jgi:hypothetical protein
MNFDKQMFEAAANELANDLFLGSIHGKKEMKKVFNGIVSKDDEYEYVLEDLPTPEEVRKEENEKFWISVNGVYNSPYIKEPYYMKKHIPAYMALWNRIYENTETEYVFKKPKEVSVKDNGVIPIGINVFSDTQASGCNNPTCSTNVAKDRCNEIWATLLEWGFLGIKMSAIENLYGRKFDGKRNGSWEYLDNDGYPYIPHLYLFNKWDFYPVRTLDETDAFGRVISRATRNYISATTGRSEVLKCKPRPDMPKGGLLGRLAGNILLRKERKLGKAFDHNTRRDMFVDLMNKMSKRVKTLVDEYYDVYDDTKLEGDLEFDVYTSDAGDAETKYYCPCCGGTDVNLKSKTPYEFKDSVVVESIKDDYESDVSKAHECVYAEDYDAEDTYNLEWIDEKTGELKKFNYKSGATIVYTESLDKTIDGGGDNKDRVLVDTIPDSNNLFDDMESMVNEETITRHKYEDRRANVVHYLTPMYGMKNGTWATCDGWIKYANGDAGIDAYAKRTVAIRKSMRTK